MLWEPRRVPHQGLAKLGLGVVDQALRDLRARVLRPGAQGARARERARLSATRFLTAGTPGYAAMLDLWCSVAGLDPAAVTAWAWAREDARLSAVLDADKSRHSHR